MRNSGYSRSPSPAKKSKSPLLQQVRNELRRRNMSIRTEEAYLQWLDRFLRFHKDQAGQWRHPRDMGSAEVNAFLTHLAVQHNVAASTQNQAFSAILFLYRNVLKVEITIDAVRAKAVSAAGGAEHR